MAKSGQKLEDVLVSHRLVSREQLDRAFAVQRRSGETLAEVVVRVGYLSEEQTLRVMAAQRGVQPWHFGHDRVNPSVATMLPHAVCREHSILPVEVRGDLLLLAMIDPHDTVAIETVRALTGLRIEPMIALPGRLREAIDRTGARARESGSVEAYIAQAMIELQQNDGVESVHEAVEGAESRPVVMLVDQIVSDAIRMGASDLHLEPRTDRIEVRYRLDGQLNPVQTFPRALLPMVAARIKIMAELDIVETRLPQDGRIALRVDGREVDLRVSVLPNHHGPRIVLRVLDRSVALRSLGELGIHPTNLSHFRRLIRKPYGMILVTGPTGSGKTTTLYAALNEVKDPSRNIMTCEDPIEYDIDGINQSQANERVGLTFASQLRSILRQDPDVVLVGEIRDHETAEIAVRASMTGHLVLSTLHANDALAALPRLVDIGLKPHLIGTSLIGVMAQRLVRRLCPHCKRQECASGDQSRVLSRLSERAVAHPVWRAEGCPTCFGTGYRGRMAVGEIVPISRSLQHLISIGASAEELRTEALNAGFRSMALDVAERVLAGQTSYEEAERVVFLEDDAEFTFPSAA